MCVCALDPSTQLIGGRPHEHSIILPSQEDMAEEVKEVILFLENA